MDKSSVIVSVPRSFFSSVSDRVRDVREVRDCGWLTTVRVGADGLRDLQTIATHEAHDDPVAAEAAALLEFKQIPA